MFKKIQPLGLTKRRRDIAAFDKATNKSLAVAVQNGAVYEPNPKMK